MALGGSILKLAAISVGVLLGQHFNVLLFATVSLPVAEGIDTLLHLRKARQLRALRRCMARHLEQVAEGMDRGALEGACLEAQRLQRFYGLSERAFAEIGFDAEIAADRVMRHARFATAGDRRAMEDACRQLVSCTYNSLKEHPELLQEVLPYLHAAMFEEVRLVRRDTGAIRDEQQRAAAALERLVEAAGTEDAPAPLSMPAMPNLVGRKQQLDELVRVLRSPGVAAPVLLRGGPGVGKSALSLAAAHDPTVAARYPRRLFVRLLPVLSCAVRCRRY